MLLFEHLLGERYFYPVDSNVFIRGFPNHETNLTWKLVEIEEASVCRHGVRCFWG